MRNHRGTSFKVWSRRRLWFWLVSNQCDSGGTIGIAATEAEAVREACSSIEEMAARYASFEDWRTGIEARAPRRALNVPAAGELMFSCLDWWTSLAHQLTDNILTRWTDLVLRSS